MKNISTSFKLTTVVAVLNGAVLYNDREFPEISKLTAFLLGTEIATDPREISKQLDTCCGKLAERLTAEQQQQFTFPKRVVSVQDWLNTVAAQNGGMEVSVPTRALVAS